METSYTLKKSLGQHFLRDENICRSIVASLQQERFTQLLEVGPGGGALTKYLLQVPDIDFKVVEIDREKTAWLLHHYPALKDKIIEADILQTEPPFTGYFSVVGNFPYNISTQIVFKMIEWRDQVPFITGMFQKEVAQRICASPGNKVYGVTSVLTQAFYETTYLFDVPASAFEPPPKVVSGVIHLKRKSEIVAMRSEKDFFLLVKTAFNQRRKMLRNAVRPLFMPDVLADEIFSKRAENLSVEDYAALSFRMQ